MATNSLRFQNQLTSEAKETTWTTASFPFGKLDRSRHDYCMFVKIIICLVSNFQALDAYLTENGYLYYWVRYFLKE